MKLQRLTRRSGGNIILEMTPLIDIVFLLLIFFLVATSFEDINSGIKIELPKSSLKEIKSVKELEINITKGKNIYLEFLEGNEKKSIKANKKTLKNILAKEIQKSENKNIVISGDKNLDYGFIVEIMNISKEAGATELDINTKFEN